MTAHQSNSKKGTDLGQSEQTERLTAGANGQRYLDHFLGNTPAGPSTR